jgi:hypothetical protein
LPAADAAVLAYTHVGNVVLMPVSVDGASGLVAADTGAPCVVLDEKVFPGAPAPNTWGTDSVSRR